MPDGVLCSVKELMQIFLFYIKSQLKHEKTRAAAFNVICEKMNVLLTASF